MVTPIASQQITDTIESDISMRSLNDKGSIKLALAILTHINFFLAMPGIEPAAAAVQNTKMEVYMQNKLSPIITAAYTPEEYDKILAISEDRDELAKDWAQWRQETNEKQSAAATQGVEYVEQYIDAEGLFKYCLGQGILANARARTGYANFLYEQHRRETTISSDNSEEEDQPKLSKQSYTPPADKLLTYTDIEEQDPFPEISYAETFGLAPEHIPELIRMATDDYLSSDDANEFESAAPLHAVKALIELRAASAIEPLITIFDKASRNDHDWMLETLVDFYTTIGRTALPALEQFLADPLHDESAQNYVAEIIGRMPAKHPEARTECIATTMRRLTDFEVNRPELNETLVRALLRMKAVEAAPLIQTAYASDRVDDFWGGDWDEAQYELGLKERPAPEERVSISPTPALPARSTISVPNRTDHKSTKRAPSSKKAKTQMAKASKKANRKKK